MSDQKLKLASGRTLGFAEYGDPHGTPLFYFHGWPGSRLQGELMDESGKKRGLRVIAPDRPGIGISDFQPGRKILDWPPLIAEVAEKLGIEKFYVLGVSGGGPYALVCAHAMPDRLLGASVVCGAPPLKEVGTGGLFWAYRLGLWTQKWLPFALWPGLRVSGWIAGRQIKQWPQSVIAAFYSDEDRKAMMDQRLHRIMMESGRVALMGNVRAVRVDGMIYSSDWKFRLEDIRVPVRFWHGDEDSNIPLALAQKAAARVPGAIFKVTPGDGHYSIATLRMDEIVGEMMAGRETSPAAAS